MPNTTQRVDIHQHITQQIISAIESGPGDLIMPWHRSGVSILAPKNVSSGKAYQGINILALWTAADAKGYQSGRWGTYRQWAAAGRQVCGGEKATTIVFYKQLDRDDAEGGTPADMDRNRSGMVAKASPVFAAEQTDGFEPPASRATSGEPFRAIDEAETFIVATEVEIRHQGERAYYSPVTDTITVPPRHLFCGTPTSSDAESFYSTVFHELGHWTGARSRLDREFGKRFGDQAYAQEELTAELTAAFLCASLEVSNSPRLDHAQYLAVWLKLLKADNRAIFVAASKASQAVRYLRERVDQTLGRSNPPGPEPRG